MSNTGRGFGHRGRGGGSGRGRSSKENVECYKCHKLEHIHLNAQTWKKM